MGDRNGNRSAPSTINDVARLANVSIATVSRVIRDQAVSEKLRLRVAQAMGELGYRPNRSAQTLRTRSSGTIACALRGVLLPGMAPFIRAAEASVRRAGYVLLLVNIEDDIQQQEDLLKFLAGRGLDGLLLTASSKGSDRIARALRAIDVPTVMIDRDMIGSSDVACVDHRAGTAAATDYLVAMGHSRIALLTVPQTIRPGRERVAGYLDVLARHGLSHNAIVDDTCFDPEQAYASSAKMLSRNPRPTAVIAGGMAILTSLIACARSQGIKIGDDLSVVAGCDSDVAQLHEPAIAAIRWDVAKWGHLAAGLLLDRLAGPGGEPASAIIQPELIIRIPYAPRADVGTEV